MSENCAYCWITTRNACSLYSGQALVEELATCGNLDRESQLRKAASAEGYSGPYTNLLKAYESSQEEEDLMKRMYNMLNDVFCESTVDRDEMDHLLREYEAWESNAHFR